jgi:hypothetical protein
METTIQIELSAGAENPSLNPNALQKQNKVTLQRGAEASSSSKRNQPVGFDAFRRLPSFVSML